MDKNKFEGARLLKAMRFAAEQHRDHRRKGKTAAPYINHPITVAEELATAGQVTDVELLMAALLHDVVEDTETTIEEVEGLFGERVARIVAEVTDDKSLSKENQRSHTVENIAGKSGEAKLLKLCDLIANVTDVIYHPPDWNRKRKEGYLDWVAEVLSQLRGTHPSLEETLDIRLEQAKESL